MPLVGILEGLLCVRDVDLEIFQLRKGGVNPPLIKWLEYHLGPRGLSFAA